MLKLNIFLDLELLRILPTLYESDHALKFELQLLGIFKDDEYFAIIKHFVDDEGSHQLSKVVSGQKLVGLSVKSISQSEVMLVGGKGDIKILRLFDLNLNEKIEGLAP